MSNSKKKSSRAESGKTKAESQKKEFTEIEELVQQKDKNLTQLSQSSKKLEQPQAKTTKSNDLKEQVDSLKTELTETSAELKDRAEQANQLQKDVDELKRIHQNVQEEKKKLKEQLQTIKQTAADPSKLETLQESLEFAGLEKEEAEQLRKKAEDKIQKLERTILELQESLAEKETPPSNGGEEIPTSKATFRISLFPGEGNYPGSIEHLPSNAKKNFQALNQKIIFDFISKHLPRQASGEEAILPSSRPSKLVDASPENEVVQYKSTQDKPAEESVVFQETKFEQSKHFVDKGFSLQARQPFNIHTHVHFPLIPTEQNMEIDTSAYTVQVITKDLAGKKVVARNQVADMLSPGVADYENKISLPAMEPGKYSLTLYTFAPFGPIEERKQLELIVE